MLLEPRNPNRLTERPNADYAASTQYIQYIGIGNLYSAYTKSLKRVER